MDGRAVSFDASESLQRFCYRAPPVPPPMPPFGLVRVPEPPPPILPPAPVLPAPAIGATVPGLCKPGVLDPGLFGSVVPCGGVPEPGVPIPGSVGSGLVGAYVSVSEGIPGVVELGSVPAIPAVPQPGDWGSWYPPVAGVLEGVSADRSDPPHAAAASTNREEARNSIVLVIDFFPSVGSIGPIRLLATFAGSVPTLVRGRDSLETRGGTNRTRARLASLALTFAIVVVAERFATTVLPVAIVKRRVVDLQRTEVWIFTCFVCRTAHGLQLPVSAISRNSA